MIFHETPRARTATLDVRVCATGFKTTSRGGRRALLSAPLSPIPPLIGALSFTGVFITTLLLAERSERYFFRKGEGGLVGEEKKTR